MSAIKQKIFNSVSSTNEEFKFPQDDEDRIQRLRLRWETAINMILAALRNSHSHSHSSTPSSMDDVIAAWFQKLTTMHSDDQRHYHTLCHLEEMFEFVDLLIDHEFEASKLNLDERDSTSSTTEMETYKAIVDLSVFFHDSVYNAKSGTNEEDSAKLFQQFVAELTRSQNNEWWGFKTVDKFIIATKTHILDGADSTKAERLFLQIFLDADMAVLGKEPKAYEHYASLIRLEYSHVPHEVYCEKRAEILASFIGTVKNNAEEEGEAPKTIYLTNSMRAALEERAIFNLQQEITSLKSGVIPQGSEK